MKRLLFPAVTLLLVLFSNQVIFAQAISLIIHDTRSDATTPLNYSQSLISNFKDAGVLGLPSVNSTFYTTIGFRGWLDNTGGKAHELAFSDDSRVFLRSGLVPSWERWREMVVSDENGNVGIGTTSPTGKFQVQQDTYDLVTGANTVDIGLGGATGGWARSFRVVNKSGSNGQDGGAFGVFGVGTAPQFVYMSLPTSDITGYNSAKILVLTNQGNVGIGTTAPDARLSVNGTIHSNEVKVDSKTWPDYVFKPDYALSPLSEVKNYIDKNQHLPEMPSEQEIIKNGLNLGEMNRLLTKKVEELTLYLIELKRSNELMEERLKKVENKL